MMNDYEEDLDNFQSENKERLVESLVWSMSRRVDRSVTVGSGITTKIPPLFLMDQRPGLSTSGWSTTGWILRYLKQKNKVQHWRTDLSETQECTKDFLTVNIWRPPMESSISETRWETHFITTSSKEHTACSSGDSVSWPKQEEETSWCSSGSASFHFSWNA